MVWCRQQQHPRERVAKTSCLVLGTNSWYHCIHYVSYKYTNQNMLYLDKWFECPYLHGCTYNSERLHGWNNKLQLIDKSRRYCKSPWKEARVRDLLALPTAFKMYIFLMTSGLAGLTSCDPATMRKTWHLWMRHFSSVSFQGKHAKHIPNHPKPWWFSMDFDWFPLISEHHSGASMDSSTVGVESLGPGKKRKVLVLLPHGPAAQFGWFRGASRTWLERSGAHNSKHWTYVNVAYWKGHKTSIYIYIYTSFLNGTSSIFVLFAFDILWSEQLHLHYHLNVLYNMFQFYRFSLYIYIYTDCIFGQNEHTTYESNFLIGIASFSGYWTAGTKHWLIIW